ncbi:hypothetical protein BaRGS_00003987, partial [Batillaria attramentaria]
PVAPRTRVCHQKTPKNSPSTFRTTLGDLRTEDKFSHGNPVQNPPRIRQPVSTESAAGYESVEFLSKSSCERSGLLGHLAPKSVEEGEEERQYLADRASPFERLQVPLF